MKRDEWTFNVAGPDLLAAAQKKLDTHRKKQKWWEEKKAEVMQKVKESGIEVKDSLAASYSNTKGFAGPEIVIDRTLQRDLTEAQSKIMEHNRLVLDYFSWVSVLESNQQQTYSLHYDDYLYFFGDAAKAEELEVK